MARPIFVKFMQGLENTKNIDYNPNVKFEEPEGGVGIELNCDVYNNIEPDQPLDDDFDEDI